MALMLDQRLSPTDTQLGRHWTLVRPPALGQSYSTVVVCFPWRGLGWNDAASKPVVERGEYDGGGSCRGLRNLVRGATGGICGGSDVRPTAFTHRHAAR